MRKSSVMAFLLAAPVILFTVGAVVGCGGKPEVPNDPNYYKGADFKQAGARGGQTGAPTKKKID